MKKRTALAITLFLAVLGIIFAQNAESRMNLVFIQVGTFSMGSPASEADRNSDETQRQVTVSDFYMGKTEVTVGEFRRFVNATGYETNMERLKNSHIWIGGEIQYKTDANWKNPYFSQGDDNPVVLVCWNDAVQYCNWLSRNEGLTPAYTIRGWDVIWNDNANGYRLPTEAEWEYACRAGTSTPFSTGTNISTSQANYNGTHPYNGNAIGMFRDRTTIVGSFPPNAWGLFDMHGNVSEWCWDWYGDYTYINIIDPAGPSSGDSHVNRGGSWIYGALVLRSTSRMYQAGAGTNNGVGFSVVRSL
jgi:formylglycine-generating enzyme required for sulfatase activity